MYSGQEAAVRTEHEIMDWFQIVKGVCQGCILSPCFFNLCMQSTSCKMLGLDEAQAGIVLLGQISITSDMQTTPPLWQEVKKN